MKEPIRGCRDWKHFALQNAMYAFVRHAKQLYGAAYCKESNCLVMFCNVLAKLSAEQRDDQLTTLRLLIKAYGAKELAYAEFPVSGMLEGSTYALLVNASELQALLLSKRFENLMKHVV